MAIRYSRILTLMPGLRARGIIIGGYNRDATSGPITAMQLAAGRLADGLHHEADLQIRGAAARPLAKREGWSAAGL